MATQTPRIHQLDQAVVNRIAAGEVVQRPVNAVKEIVENAMDAGATQLTVTIKEGGYKLLQVQDNGHGIQEVDLPLLCVRHATSKLRSFEDLEQVGTLGFRGEALASISFVAHLTVTTMTPGAAHGWKASYRDGELQPGSPQPCAALPGTIIQVEDLFFNMATRRKALKNVAEEYSRVLDLLQRYAVHVPAVAFSCKRQGESRMDLHTPEGTDQLSVIRAVYGAVAKSLLPLKCASATPLSSVTDTSSNESVFEAKGWVSSADYDSRKSQLVLFVNGRPVEWRALRRGLEAVYAAVLPKTAKLFCYLDVRVPGSHVDVNVHPTKHEVALLHSDELIAAICTAAQALLATNSTQRTFNKPVASGQQASLPQSLSMLEEAPTDSLEASQAGGNTQRKKAGGDHKLVRTDPSVQTLHRFFGASQQAAISQTPPPPEHCQLAPSQAPEGDPEPLAGVAKSLLAETGGGKGDSPGREQRFEARGEAVAGISTPAEETLGNLTGQPLGASTAAAAASAPRRVNRGGVRSREVWDASLGNTGLGDEPPQRTQQGRRSVRQKPNPPPSELASIAELIAEVEQDVHAGLLGLVRSQVFVGLLEDSLALLQGGTRLYAVDLTPLSRDLFYQQVLRRWERCAAVKLEPPLPLRDLVRMAIELLYAQDPAAQEGDTTPKEVADSAAHLLVSKAAILEDYVGVSISAEGCLESLPQLIEGYDPDTDRLPLLALALARDVDWSAEKTCFHTLAQVLADFFCWQPSLFPEKRRSFLPPKLTSSHLPKADLQAFAQQQPLQGVDLQQEPPEDLSMSLEASLDSTQSIPLNIPESNSAATDASVLVALGAGEKGLEADKAEVSLRAPEGGGSRVEGIEGMSSQKGQGSASAGKKSLSSEEVPSGAEAMGADELAEESEEELVLLEAEGKKLQVGKEASSKAQQERAADQEWVVEHVLLPAMRAFLKPPACRGADGSVVELTRLEKLYKVFERC